MANLSVGASAQITPFSFNSHAVRVIQRDGQPWFVAADVCAALGYSNTSKALGDHLDADERNSALVPTPNAPLGVPTNVISESGLYALVLRSRKPEARKFAKWVTSEVLPAIRKTGKYEAKPDAAPSLSSRRWLISYDHTGREQAQAVPFDAFVMNFAEFAKAIVEPGGMMPSNVELANLAAACNARLAGRLECQASKKVVTV